MRVDGENEAMRTISVCLDDASEARLDNLCQTLGLTQSDVVMGGLALLERQSISPAALAERLGLIGSFSSATSDNTTTSPGRDHGALLPQKLSRQQKQQRLDGPQT